MRTRIVFSKVIVNPYATNLPVDSEKLQKILNIGLALSDKTSIGKMRDSYPIQLFTFRNSIMLYDANYFEAFVYVFIFALFNETLLNHHISVNTRLYLLEIFIDILIFFSNKFTKASLPENLGMTKKGNEYVTILNMTQINRFLSTDVGLYREISLEIYKDEKTLSLNRLGTHVIENTIGQIRCLCNYDHRMVNILRTTARMSYIRTLSESFLPIEKKRNRINTAGCKLSMGKLEIDFGISSLQCSHSILKLIGFDFEGEEIVPIDVLKNNTSKFVESVPFKMNSNHSLTSNITIINRLTIKLDEYFHPIRGPNPFNVDDSNLMRQLILEQKTNDEILEAFKHKEKSKNEIMYIKKKTMQILNDRPFDAQELILFSKVLQGQITAKEMAKLCICRTTSKIEAEIKKFV